MADAATEVPSIPGEAKLKVQLRDGAQVFLVGEEGSQVSENGLMQSLH